MFTFCLVSRCLATSTCSCGLGTPGLCTRRRAGTPRSSPLRPDPEGSRSQRPSNIQEDTKKKKKNSKTTKKKTTQKCTWRHHVRKTHARTLTVRPRPFNTYTQNNSLWIWWKQTKWRINCWIWTCFGSGRGSTYTNIPRAFPSALELITARKKAMQSFPKGPRANPAAGGWWGRRMFPLEMFVCLVFLPVLYTKAAPMQVVHQIPFSNVPSLSLVSRYVHTRRPNMLFKTWVFIAAIRPRGDDSLLAEFTALNYIPMNVRYFEAISFSVI